KRSIGQLEAGAGIAGLVKVALMLRHRMLPPHLHLVTPNSTIEFEKLKLRLPRDLEPLPTGRVLAGVNSFGFGGANAHAVLESPPAEPCIASLAVRYTHPGTNEPCLLSLPTRAPQ